MIIFPALDILDKKAVRLLRGDFDKVSVFASDPVETACKFESEGSRYIHVVDLDGARKGDVHCYDIVSQICSSTSLFVEIGGGIRNIETIRKYVDAGVKRVIIGTAAVTDPCFLENAVSEFGEYVAVGADVRDGFISINGWIENTGILLQDFVSQMQNIGIRNIICTDISKDGAMSGTNLDMYRRLSCSSEINITASGGISSLDDIRALNKYGLYGAIVGKAIYSGAVSIRDAIKTVSAEV